jgi:hypothetical protein
MRWVSARPGTHSQAVPAVSAWKDAPGMSSRRRPHGSAALTAPATVPRTPATARTEARASTGSFYVARRLAFLLSRTDKVLTYSGIDLRITGTIR